MYLDLVEVPTFNQNVGDFAVSTNKIHEDVKKT